MPQNEEFIIKDSGERMEYASGMRRDIQEDKTLFSLPLRGPMFKRWAEHLTKGALKYGVNNWMLAGSNPVSAQEELDRFKESAIRHFIQWFEGERDEDHAAAVYFNINCAEYVINQINERKSDEPH